MTTTDVLLSATDLNVRYGGVAAVNRLTFDLRPGEVVGLIGPNGAGKTSAIDALTGFAACSGTVRLGTETIGSLPAHVRARRGLARTFQQLELCVDLTVHDNLIVAARATRRGDGDTVARALRVFGLESYRDTMAGRLPHGTRRMVAAARAYATNPSVMLLDEPAAGLDVHEADELRETLRSVADEGRGILLIEHDMALVMRICDRLLVLDFGTLIAEGPPDKVRTDPSVVGAYLGVQHEVDRA